MQVQKDDVRNSILTSAKDEFFEFGFMGASLRRIALNAGVTAGNIYAYFSSKSALLDSILQETLNDLDQLIRELSKSKTDADFDLNQITEEISKIFLKYNKQFMILMNGSKGTKYENIKSQLCIMVNQRIVSEFLPMLSLEFSETISAEAFSAALIEGIFYIFNQYNGDEILLKKTIDNFMLLIFGARL